MYRVRFTPQRQDRDVSGLNSDGRGRKPTVQDYRIFKSWYSQGQITEIAREWNQRELSQRKLMMESPEYIENLWKFRGQIAPPEFSTYSRELERWKKS